MRRKIVSAVVFAVTFAGLALLTPGPFACGGDYGPSGLTSPTWPDVPLPDYATAELGIVLPTYHRIYLYVAYRRLAGPEFSDQEKEMLRSGFGPSGQPGGERQKSWFEQWRALAEQNNGEKASRQQAQAWPGGMGIYRAVPGEPYQDYLNCPESAFQNAVLTYRERSTQIGATAGVMRDWAQAQARVFSNCGTAKAAGAEPVIPSPPEPEWPTLLRADRAYQIAAAYFYGERFDEAREHFERIEGDPMSPWRAIAPYLAARALVRKGTLSGKEGTINREALTQAEQKLRLLLTDPARKEWHDAARRLLGFVRLRTEPQARLRELAAAVGDPASASSRKQDLIDYTWMLDRMFGHDWAYSRGASGDADDLRFEQVRSQTEAGDITDWILTFQSATRAAKRHSMVRWEERNTPAWLLAALAKVRGGDREAPALLDAARKIPRTHPGYVAITFHRLRILAEGGEPDLARKEFDAIFGEAWQGLPPSAVNLLRGLRMKLATGLTEFLRYASRDFAMGGWFGPQTKSPGPYNPTAVDEDVVRAVNGGMPLEQLARAAAMEALPPNPQRAVVLAAWLRALQLNRLETADELLPKVKKVAPEVSDLLEPYRKAASAEAKMFAAAFVILQYEQFDPALGRYTGTEDRGGLWCTPGQTSRYELFDWSHYQGWDGNPLAVLYPPGADVEPAFLSKGEREAAQREWETLTGLPPGPNYLGKIVLTWARKHPDDARVPEALHRVVRATRFGCGDDQTAEISRSAFRLLHQRYPANLWTKRSPYWYQGRKPF